MGSMARTGSNKGSLAHPHSHSHPNSNSGSTTITAAVAAASSSTAAASHGSNNNGKGDDKEANKSLVAGPAAESSVATAAKPQPSTSR